MQSLHNKLKCEIFNENKSLTTNMFFSVITKNLHCEILTKNLLTFKRWGGGYLKNPIFKGGFMKKQYT